MKQPHDVAAARLLTALQDWATRSHTNVFPYRDHATQSGGEHHEAVPLHNYVRVKPLASILRNIARHREISVGDLLTKLRL